MFSKQFVLTLLILHWEMASGILFNWDIVVAEETRLQFFYKGTVTYTADIPSAHYITSVTYDPVHYRVLMAEYFDKKLPIYSFDLTTRKTQTLVMKQTSESCHKRLAYDPVTQLLFWTECKKIYSLSLKPASSNVAVDGNLIATADVYFRDIDVDSCGGYIYWVTDDNIERAAFDGSEREVLINEHVFGRWSLAIDQQTKTMYWIDEFTANHHCIKSADLKGENRLETFYLKGTEYYAAALTISKDFIYWKSYNRHGIMQFPKQPQHGVAPVVYTQSSHCSLCQLTAANYTIEEQTLGNEPCEALKTIIPDVEERHGSVCHNYCFQGNCTVSAEGHPKCSCEAGYYGERCETNPCHMYCLNNGVCSVNEAEKPVCQCTADYEGEKCDVSICKDYCLQGNCSIGIEGQRICSCEAGYSGERCEANSCHMYCLNNGVCSVNEAEKPVCQCTADYKGERCDVSTCKDYCLQGNCSVSTEGQPTCRCTAGYTGERCEVNACHEHCLNNGDCSLNEEDEPFCQCTADYQGERCDIATTHHVDDMTLQISRDLRSEMKQVLREELQCTLQLYSDKLGENAVKIQKCEEAMKYNLQSHDVTTSKTQTSSIKF